MDQTPHIEVLPANAERWNDLQQLFGPNGAVAGCWCMWWFQSSREFEANHGDPNRALLEAKVRGETPPGLLAYVDGRVAGWCAIGPRDAYGRLQRSRNLGAGTPDDRAWAIVCFYIAPWARRMGIARALTEAAVAFAREHGAATVESYPVDTTDGRKRSSGDVFTGVPAVFESAGFTEVERRAPARPIMRRRL